MADVTVLYFLNSGEVFKISKGRDGKPARDWTGQFDPAFVGQMNDPQFVDPASADAVLPRDPQTGKLVGAAGSLSKVTGFNSVRLATQAEYETFDASRVTMENEVEAKEAERRLLTSPRYRKIFKALVKRILQLNNNNAAQINGIKTAIANATTLADVKSAVGNLPALNDSITLQQALTALQSDISPDD